LHERLSLVAEDMLIAGFCCAADGYDVSEEEDAEEDVSVVPDEAADAFWRLISDVLVGVKAPACETVFGMPEPAAGENWPMR